MISDDKNTDRAGRIFHQVKTFALLSAVILFPLTIPVLGGVPGLVALIPLLKRNGFEKIVFYVCWWCIAIHLRPLRMD